MTEVGNSWHACQTWHASASVRHVSEAVETRSSPFKVSVSSISFVNNPLFNLTLVCFWCRMATNRAVSAGLRTPQLGRGAHCHRGPKFRPLTTNFGWHAEEFSHWFSGCWHANRKRLPALAIWCHILAYIRALKKTADLLIRSLCNAFVTLFTKHIDSAKLQFHVEQCCDH